MNDKDPITKNEFLVGIALTIGLLLACGIAEVLTL